LAQRDRSETSSSVHYVVIEDEADRRIPEPARVRPRGYAVVVHGRR
jgi:hypothetical protein